MAETKPGVELNQEGICQACTHRELRDDVDYDARFERLKNLADQYRRDGGEYDCLIPVSGGKDSYYQTYLLKEELEMNPLLVAVTDPFTHTEAGQHNLQNLSDEFNCDLVIKQISVSTTRKMMRVAFEEFGSPTWPIDRAIYCAPIQVAIEKDIPFIVYGENVSWEYGGVQDGHDAEESYSAIDQIENDVAKDVDFDLWLENGLNKSDLNMMQYPSMDALNEAGLEPIYLSYFSPWDGQKNYNIAKKFGFRDLSNEWDRDGYIEDYDQIDSVGYLINVYLKYPKYGFCRATDVVGYWRRSNRVDISIEEGVELIRKNDHQLDQRILNDFLDFTGYSDREFWEILNNHRNEELFPEPFLSSGELPRPVDDFENIDLA